MEKYLSFSQENLWGELWPELALCLSALFVLAIDLFSKSDTTKKKAGIFAIFFQFSLLCIHLLDYLLLRHTFDRESFRACSRHGFQQDLIRTFFLLSSCLVSLLAHQYLLSRKLRIGEFHHLSMLATAALMLLCQSQHFIVFFIALETVSLCFYPLVAFNRDSQNRWRRELNISSLVPLVQPFCFWNCSSLWGWIKPSRLGANLSTSPALDYFSFDNLYHLLVSNPEHPLLEQGLF